MGGAPGGDGSCVVPAKPLQPSPPLPRPAGHATTMRLQAAWAAGQAGKMRGAGEGRRERARLLTHVQVNFGGRHGDRRAPLHAHKEPPSKGGTKGRGLRDWGRTGAKAARSPGDNKRPGGAMWRAAAHCGTLEIVWLVTQGLRTRPHCSGAAFRRAVPARCQRRRMLFPFLQQAGLVARRRLMATSRTREEVVGPQQARWLLPPAAGGVKTAVPPARMRATDGWSMAGPPPSRPAFAQLLQALHGAPHGQSQQSGRVARGPGRGRCIARPPAVAPRLRCMLRVCGQPALRITPARQ